MGEATRRKTATQKLIEQSPFCCFCGGAEPATTREHMPAKSLFDGSRRPDDLVMPACGKCNGGTSTADLAVALISRWKYDNTPQEQADHRRLARRMWRQAPELIAEWTKDADRVAGRQHLLKHGVNVPPDAGLVMVGPETISWLNVFAHKATLGLYFHHLETPLTDAGCVYASWSTKEDFARHGLPAFILEMLPGYGTLTQGRWNESKTFEYRHALNFEQGLFGCFARFRQGLFVTGFATADAARIPSDDHDWIKPSELLAMRTQPHFRKRR